MVHHVYILFSVSLNKYYTGFSRFTDKRTRQHNKAQTSWTSKATDWEKVWMVQVSSVDKARDLEKKIKSCGAKRFLERHKEKPNFT